MSATRDTKEETVKTPAKTSGGGEGHQEHGGGGLVGAIGAGLGRLFANMLPAGFKSAKVKDTATQVLKTPLGGSIVGTYTSEIEITGAPEVIQAIEEAKEETERAVIAADADVAKAKLEAGKADEEDE